MFIEYPIYRELTAKITLKNLSKLISFNLKSDFFVCLGPLLGPLLLQNATLTD